MIGGKGGIEKKKKKAGNWERVSDRFRGLHISPAFFFQSFLFADACHNAVCCHPSQICHEVRGF